MACKLCKQSIKYMIRDELQCDYGFIKCLMKDGEIQRLQDACADLSGTVAVAQEIRNRFREKYEAYCRERNLDFSADNRMNRDYLKNREED